MQIIDKHLHTKQLSGRFFSKTRILLLKNKWCNNLKQDFSIVSRLKEKIKYFCINIFVMVIITKYIPIWHMMSQICKNYANFVQIVKNSFGVIFYKEAELKTIKFL